MKKLTTEEFITKANLVHNYKYSYQKTNYINNLNKLIITCPIHGDFEQRATNHLQKHGCSKCEKVYSYSTKEFIDKCNKIHNFKYNYNLTKYINSKTKIKIICKVHGIFEQAPHEHLKGSGCSKCANSYPLTIGSFIKKASKIHNNKYDYSKTIYKNNSTKVKIVCPIHGIFVQLPYNHLSGAGCSKCYKRLNGFSKTNWINNCNTNKISYLYIIKCFNEEEEFIKIGISSTDINKRFSSYFLPYNYTIEKIINSSPDIIWKEEKRLHKIFNNFSYNPKISFSGKNECFTLDILPLIQNSTDLYPLSPY